MRGDSDARYQMIEGTTIAEHKTVLAPKVTVIRSSGLLSSLQKKNSFSPFSNALHEEDLLYIHVVCHRI